MTQTTQINHSNYQEKKNEYDTIYQKIKAYLKEVRFLSEENIIYPEQIVDNIYSAIQSDKKHLTELAAILASITTFSEEEDKKLILEELLKKKLDYFICQTVFRKNSFLEFVADWVKCQKEDDKKTIASIHKEITYRSTHLAEESILKINEDIIFLCMPIFKYYLQIQNRREIEEIEKIRIDSIPWAYSYAALHFINDHDIYLNSYNYEEILQIGVFLEYTIKKGSLPENVRYFLIPAALSYAINNTNLSVEEILNSLELKQKAVTAFFDSVEKENETIKETLPNRQFIKAIEGYKTRTELAKEQLASIGFTDNEILIAAYKTAPDSLPSAINSQLPNLTALFQNQNKNIAEKFRKVESVFIQDAIESLSIEERDFFNFGQVSYFKISFMEERSYRWVPRRNKRKDEYNKPERLFLPAPPQHPDTLLLELPGHIYSLIHIKYINQEKYFILFSDDNMKYIFHEINATNIKSKYEYLPLLEKINTISSKVIEEIKNPSCIVELEKCEILKTEDEPATKLVEELTRIRKDYFRDHLYQAGHEATIFENIADFVKHLIPFYDTIQSLRAGKKLEAAGYFALDLLTFLPLISEAGKISTSMHRVLLSAAHLSRIRMTRYLMTGSLIFSIQNTAPFFFRQGILGASNLLTRQTFIDVLKAAVRSVDPGIELCFIGGKYIYKQSNRLRNKILQEFNSYNDYSPIYQNLLISMLSKPSVEVPLQKKFITHEMLSNAIELAQSNKYEAVINELTSLKRIVPKVDDMQTYPLYNIDYRRDDMFLMEVNYPSAGINRIDASTIASASHLNIPDNPINKLPIEVSLSDTLIHINISSTRICSLQGLPKKLKYLNISNTIIRELPPLPDTLTHLNISETLIYLLPSLPKNLKNLDISNTIIHNLPPLPDTLTDLNIYNTHIESLLELPNALKNLNISKTGIELLPKLPDTLTNLDIEDTIIALLPKLPDKLTYLDISNTEISKLPTLPKKLTHLHASGTQIESLPTLPITLTDLDLFDTKITVLTEEPNQKLPKNLTRLNISDTLIVSLPNLPDTLTDLNISNTIISSLPELPKKLTYFNASNTRIELLPKLPKKLTYLNASNTKIESLPKLPDTLTNLDISNTIIRELPPLPDTLTDLDISNTKIDQLPDFLFKKLKRLNIFNTPLLSLTFNNMPPASLFDCEIINRTDLDVIRPIQERLSHEQITEQIIKQWIEKNRVEFKITKFLPKNKFSHSSVITQNSLINKVYENYDIPEYTVGIEDDFYFHPYGSAKESIPDRFTKLRNEFEYFSGEVERTKEYIISVKYKILDDYTEIYNNEFGFILKPKMVEFFNGTRNISILKHSKVRIFFQNLLHTKDILIIHEVINRFYFYVKNIEIYLNDYVNKIFFVSTPKFNLNTNKLVMGFTDILDQERKVILLLDAILDDNSIWSVSHVLMHEISHAIGGAEDLFPTIRSTENYNINTHLLEIATGKDIHDLDTVFLESMIAEYTKIHNLPENTISTELFLKIFKHDQMLRANIIMENADFISHLIRGIASLE